MTTYTEAQFSEAMTTAVALRGSEWRYPREYEAPRGYYVNGQPTYSDNAGQPTCLIGLAMSILGMRVPESWATTSAMAVVKDVPLRVVLAARVAQMHQDRSRPWGECLAMYRAALEITTRDKRAEGVYADGDSLYTQARRRVEASSTRPMSEADVERAAEAVKQAAQAFVGLGEAINGLASGGKVTIPVIPKQEFSFKDLACPTITFNTIDVDLQNLITGMNKAIVAMPTQKEHALIA